MEQLVDVVAREAGLGLRGQLQEAPQPELHAGLRSGKQAAQGVQQGLLLGQRPGQGVRGRIARIAEVALEAAVIVRRIGKGHLSHGG
ncbi:MAG: hypothetical protein QM742_16020 [Aquabacterium sp.]